MSQHVEEAVDVSKCRALVFTGCSCGWRDYNGMADNPGNDGDRGGDPGDNRNRR